MFYEPGVTPHNLPHDPFKSCVVPRPIGWLSTISPDGRSRNLAPYSQFQNLTFDPPYVMFAANQSGASVRKDTVVNAEATGRFVWNMATYALRHAVNASAEQVPYGVDEFARAGVTPVPSVLLGDCPMVAESPVRFECRYHCTVRLPGNGAMGSVDVVIGRVVGIHLEEWALDKETGMIDVLKLRPIARLGYYQYTVVNEVFEMRIPGEDGALMQGLEGRMGTSGLEKGEADGNQTGDGEDSKKGEDGGLGDIAGES